MSPAARALSVNVLIIRLESCRPCWLGATLIAIAMSALCGRSDVIPRTNPSSQPVGRSSSEPSHGERDGVCFGEKVVAVDESDLEVREVRVQPIPVEVARLVLVHVRGERGLGELLEPTSQEIGSIGVADDLHR